MERPAASSGSRRRPREHLDTARAFEDLYRSHHERVRAYVARRVARDEVDDIVATTFAIAWRRFADVPAAEPGRTMWLVRTAHLVELNARRANRRSGALIAKLEVQPDSARPPDGEADLRDLEPYVIDALEQLSPQDRYLVIATVWQGRTASDLAVALGCSHGAVRTRLSRARARLRKLLRLHRGR